MSEVSKVQYNKFNGVLYGIKYIFNATHVRGVKGTLYGIKYI